MKHLTEVFLICCCLIASSRSAEDMASTLKADSPTTSTNPASTLSLSTSEDTETTTMRHLAKQLPVDLLSPDQIFLDPNVVLARVARGAYRQQPNYGGWGQTNYGGWGQLQQPQQFGGTYERRPFGIPDYMKTYNRNRLDNRPDSPKRRNGEVRRVQVTTRPFRVYPVFPG